jgi:hypothetical protein
VKRHPSNDAGLLARAGAGIVVTTLDEVNRSALADGRLATKGAQITLNRASAPTVVGGRQN